jgi:hypothetical protein
MLRHILPIACLYVCLSAFAAGGDDTYPLDWPHAGEVLAYHSCGCADSCWVAEVKNRRTNKLRARLRCDCETLSYEVPSRKPVMLGSCEAINGSTDKAGAISAKLEELLRPAKSQIGPAK